MTIYDVGEYVMIRQTDFMAMENHIHYADLAVCTLFIILSSLVLSLLLYNIFEKDKEDH